MYVVPLCVLGVAVVLFAASFTVTRDMGKLRDWMDGVGVVSGPAGEVDGAAAESV